MPVIGVAVHGDVDERTLRAVAKEVRDDILDLEGISRVSLMGIRAREWRVQITPEALEAAGVTFDEVGRALSSGNRDMPGGQLKGVRGNVPVRTLGERTEARELESLVVRAKPDGRAVRLGALGRIDDTFDEDANSGMFDGDRAVMITVSKTNEEDALVIAEAVRNYVKDNPSRLGGAVTLTKTTDLARMIEGRLELMTRNGKTGLILVLITLAIFLELRVAIWVALGLPIAFLAAFIAMPYFGVSLNMISMFGLIVVLGMIVDDGIIIGENIFTKLRQGMPPKEAAIKGAEEVTWPVLAAIATTCVAFAPLLFMPGRMGTFMAVIPLVVIAALLVSLIEAFMILPAHLSHDYFGFLGRFVPGGAKGLGERFTSRRRDFIEGWLPDNYERWLRFGLRWRYPALALAFSALLGSIGLVASGLIQFQLFERADAETISVDLEMAAGTPAEVTAAVLKRFEDRARSLPEVQNVFGSLGSSFSETGMTAAADPSIVGQLNVELVPSADRERMGLRKSLDVEADLRKAAIGVSGIRRLKVAGRVGGPGGAEMKVRVRGGNLDDVGKAVAYIKSQVADFEGVEEIRDDLQPGKQEVRLRLNAAGESLGLTTQGIAVAMRGALFGVEAQDLQAEDEEVKVRVQLPRSDRASLADLGRLRIAAPGGGRVPLEEVADLSLSRGYASMRRVDGKRAVTVEV
ncbi:MAG: efflux RND transporter permease subunit, partial [Planctomycetota bacterium]